MSQKKDIKLLKKLLKDDKKRNLYTPEELLYMEKQYVFMKAERKAIKKITKLAKGFGNP